MGTVTYRDSIAILQLVVFPFIFAAALFIWKRAGWRIGRKIWRFALVLALIRIVGSICSLMTISHDSYNLKVAAAVCELIGIAPLLLIYVGILRQM
jgi:NhaP-type Na+/H+ or K+/H+ antiporter